jgi:putative toxin-antitoxin system antitoxin component (TIGR02293 family)
VQAAMHRGVAATPDQDFAAREIILLQHSGELLGAGKVFKRVPKSRMEVHSAILDGAFPYAALLTLLSGITLLNETDLTNALGISARTLRRQREAPKKAMPADLASKTWLFAETLTKATEVFGSREKAEEWMNRPAMGLDGRRPIEMLQTAQGTEIVTDFLTRLEYDVYS